jgi:cytochrome c oxidase assembly protein subunit 15
LKIITAVTILVAMTQVVLGTQVREQVDHISAALNFNHRETWINKLNSVFEIHRTFSFAVAALCIYLYFQYKKLAGFQMVASLILFAVLANILLGIIMSYFDMPAIAQPLHLLFSSVLVTSLYYQWLKTG